MKIIKRLFIVLFIFSINNAYSQNTTDRYFLRIIKNNAGWFGIDTHNTANNRDTVSYAGGWAPINDTITILLPMPSPGITSQYDLVPHCFVFRELDVKHTPDRGFWHVSFYIIAQGRDQVKRRVTPIYDITARSYFDDMTVFGDDTKNNESFIISLIDNFNANDCKNMLKGNIDSYNSFNSHTRRKLYFE